MFASHCVDYMQLGRRRRVHRFYGVFSTSKNYTTHSVSFVNHIPVNSSKIACL